MLDSDDADKNHNNQFFRHKIIVVLRGTLLAIGALKERNFFF